MPRHFAIDSLVWKPRTGPWPREVATVVLDTYDTAERPDDGLFYGPSTVHYNRAQSGHITAICFKREVPANVPNRTHNA